MNTDFILTLTSTFEAHAQKTENEVEYSLARDLQSYTEWRNFTAVINKAKSTFELSVHRCEDHFVDVNKMVPLPDGAKDLLREIGNKIAIFLAVKIVTIPMLKVLAVVNLQRRAMCKVSQSIRPLRVKALTYPERSRNPGAFFVSTGINA